MESNIEISNNSFSLSWLGSGLALRDVQYRSATSRKWYSYAFVYGSHPTALVSQDSIYTVDRAYEGRPDPVVRALPCMTARMLRTLVRDFALEHHRMPKIRSSLVFEIKIGTIIRKFGNVREGKAEIAICLADELEVMGQITETWLITRASVMEVSGYTPWCVWEGAFTCWRAAAAEEQFTIVGRATSRPTAKRAVVALGVAAATAVGALATAHPAGRIALACGSSASTAYAATAGKRKSPDRKAYTTIHIKNRYHSIHIDRSLFGGTRVTLGTFYKEACGVDMCLYDRMSRKFNVYSCKEHNFQFAVMVAYESGVSQRLRVGTTLFLRYVVAGENDIREESVRRLLAIDLPISSAAKRLIRAAAASKERVFTILGPPLLPRYVYGQNQGTVTQAVLGRVLAYKEVGVPNDARSKSLRAACKTAAMQLVDRMKANDVVEWSVEQLEQYYRLRDAGKWRRYMETLARSSDYLAKVRTFVKAESYPLDDPKKPRAIQAREIPALVHSFFVFKPIEHYLFFDRQRILEDSGFPREFGKGRNDRERYEDLSKHWDYHNRRGRGGARAISVDARAFDGHVNEFQVKLEHQVYAAMGLPEWITRAMYDNFCRSFNGIVYKCRYGRMSGDAHTALGNCLLVWTFLRAGQEELRKQKESVYTFYDDGDDVVVFCCGEDVERVSDLVRAIYHAVGHETRFFKVVDAFNRIEFCQGRPGFSADGCGVMRKDPETMIAKLMTYPRDLNSAAEMARFAQKVDAYRAAYPEYPVIRHLPPVPLVGTARIDPVEHGAHARFVTGHEVESTDGFNTPPYIVIGDLVSSGVTRFRELIAERMASNHVPDWDTYVDTFEWSDRTTESVRLLDTWWEAAAKDVFSHLADEVARADVQVYMARMADEWSDGPGAGPEVQAALAAWNEYWSTDLE